METSTSSFNILSLDGGGLRGIFTAAVLAEAELAFDDSFIDSFNLIVGTSTGGLIALGLASGLTCKEVLSFYQELGLQVFRHPRRLSRLFRPKYDRAVLDSILRDKFGETAKMNDLTKPVCITSHELVSGTSRVWKDDHSPELRWGGDQLIWKVAAATSAAPTYLAPVQLGDADSQVDGGVWGNNPALVGITEAVRYGGRSLSDIRLLSIGTTNRPLRIERHAAAEHFGLLAWLTRSIELLQGASAGSVNNQAKLLLGEDSFLRIDSDRAQKVALDDYRQCAPLQEWGHDLGRRSISRIGRLLDL
ncbi:CBASS cGAMP-activated phospholipase [Amycolatopsis magusensis]|uniref:CBASS cGAMP-activated phospholipase n=1 Tax=Amycolatopsis magusensis TaxID=882444 RepID=UPI003C2D87D4